VNNSLEKKTCSHWEGIQVSQKKGGRDKELRTSYTRWGVGSLKNAPGGGAGNKKSLDVPDTRKGKPNPEPKVSNRKIRLKTSRESQKGEHEESQRWAGI